MKLIVQIPCLNEEDTLPAVLADIPRTIPGIDVVEVLIIDDGCTDNTVAVAKEHGAEHVVSHPRNLGLAQAFQTGIDTSLSLGADVIVHTDADGQYPGKFIYALVAPIVENRAEMVIGNRPIAEIEHFSPLKKLLQQIGSKVVRTVSGTDVPDTVSGFRAYSRECALRFTILTRFSYTLETIIQAGKKGLTIVNIPIEISGPTRPSRLQKNMFHFIKHQGATIVRLYAFYEPLRTFTYLSIPFLLMGFGLLIRFFLTYLISDGSGRYIQSVSIATGLLVVGILIMLFGILADVVGKHRQLTEETLYRLRKAEWSKPDE